MLTASESLPTFEAARHRAGKFCQDRQWEQFHLPTSLALALSGECGELCEIFQWKGTLEEEYQQGQLKLAEKELVHIGEEIADVFIYTTRLSDVCHIDLATAVQSLVPHDELYPQRLAQVLRTNAECRVWAEVSFEEAATANSCHPQGFRSHRQVALQLQSQVGLLTTIFAKYPESTNHASNVDWMNAVDVQHVASALSSIVLLLLALTKMAQLSLGQVVADKFAKNEAKYPAALVKGSSAKYTAYRSQLKAAEKKASKHSGNMVKRHTLVMSAVFLGVVGFLFGKMLRYRRR